MLKRILFLAVFLALFPAGVLAQTKINAILTSALDIVNKIILILGTLALAAFGWGIVKFILAAQNPEERNKAKSIILWAIIGLFIISSIGGILKFAGDYFGVGSGKIIPAPKLP